MVYLKPNHDVSITHGCILLIALTAPVSKPLCNKELLMLLVVVRVAGSSGSRASGFLAVPKVPTSWCCVGCSARRGEGGCGRLPGFPSVSKGWVGERGADKTKHRF